MKLTCLMLLGFLAISAYADSLEIITIYRNVKPGGVTTNSESSLIEGPKVARLNQVRIEERGASMVKWLNAILVQRLKDIAAEQKRKEDKEAIAAFQASLDAVPE